MSDRFFLVYYDQRWDDTRSIRTYPIEEARRKRDHLNALVAKAKAENKVVNVDGGTWRIHLLGEAIE